MILEIINTDITTLDVDAIVNAANKSLICGGGVDGVIRRAAGPELLNEVKTIRKNKYPDGLPVGKAVITKGHNLSARHIIHTVGPLYNKDENSLLRECYISCLNIAEENGLKSIAFPAISTGAFGFPKKEALLIVKNVIEKYNFNSIERVVLCFFSKKDKEIAEEVFN